MGVYIAPEIKDRVAVGDDLYQITDSGGKKKLTPDPTSVSEVGTAINKALLQPIADALQAATETLMPYEQYWWRRRAVASSYSETRQSAIGYGYSHTSNGTTYYMLGVMRYQRGADEETGTDYYATLQYASSITINQSTGVISLKNPSTYAVTGSESMYDSSFYSRFQGRYVKGFLGYTGSIFYIPPSAYTTEHNWETSAGDITRESGFEFTEGTSASYMPLLIGSVKNAAIGSWELISSDASDTYPRSGTSDGYEWVYCGKISDAALSNFAPELRTVNITSASYSGDSFTVDLPGSVCLFWCNYRYSSGDSGFPSGVIITDTKSAVYRAISGVYYSKSYGSATYDSRQFMGSTIGWNYYNGSTKTFFMLFKIGDGKLYFGSANGNSVNAACQLCLLPIAP